MEIIAAIKMNFEDLYERLELLTPFFKESDKNLEEYWRSIYPLIIENRNQIPTLELFCKILEKGIQNEPIDLDKKWLLINESPNSNISNENSPHSESDEVDYLLSVLEFQIAELFKMKDKQLKEEHRYFGLDSETGHRWYNFDPISNLECGVAGMTANGFSEDTKSWIVLGKLIEMGRIYE